MAFDAHLNLGVTSVVTPPSPATTGTTVTITAGHGATRVPPTPCNAIVYPGGGSPDPTNAEIIRVTGRSTDTLTIVRSAETLGVSTTTPRTIVAGDTIAFTATRKTFTDIEQGVGVGTYAITGLLGNGSDEGASLNAKLAATPVGATVLLPNLTVDTAVGIDFPPGREYVGPGAAFGYAGFTLRQRTGAALTTALAATSGYWSNATTSDNPTVFRNICFDGNSASCPSSTASVLVIMGFWSRVEDCLVYNSPADGIRVTDTPQNGTPILNSSSENVVRGCRVDGAVGAGINVVSNAFNGPLDGFIENCRLKDCGYGIVANRAAGWRIVGNHLYGIGFNGIDCDGGFATRITDNYIEDFGGHGASGFYAGIQLKLYDGYGSVVSGNTIGVIMADAGSSYYPILVSSQTGQVGAECTVLGNVLNGSGGTNGAGLALYAGGGTLVATETANIIRGFPNPTDLGNILLVNDSAQPKQASEAARNVMLVEGIAGSSTPTVQGITTTAIGTATATTWGTSNALASVQRISYVSAGAAGSSGGVRGASTSPVWRGNATGLGGFVVVVRFGFATIPATRRWFCGVALNAPTNADPSSFTSLIGVGQDAADTLVQFMHNDAAGTATKSSSGVSSPVVGEVWEVRITHAPNGSQAFMSLARVSGSGIYAEYTTGASTDLPSSTSALFPVLWANNASTASLIDPHLVRMYVETPL